MFEGSLGIAQKLGHSHEFAQRLQQSTTARSKPGPQYLGHHGESTIGVVKVTGSFQGGGQLHLRVERVGGILAEAVVLTPELFIQGLHDQSGAARISGSKLQSIETTLVIGELQSLVPEFFGQSRSIVEEKSQ